MSNDITEEDISQLFLPPHGTKKERLINNLTKIAAVCCLIASTLSSAIGQELDMDCRPITLQCNPIQVQIDTIEGGYRAEIEALSEELPTASPSRKAFIIAEIRRLKSEWANNQELKQLKIDLATCRHLSLNTPRRPVEANVLNTRFTGNVVVKTTHPDAAGPFTKNLNLELQFSHNRCNVTITSFPAITFHVESVVDVDVTVSKTNGGTGSFFPVTGQMLLPLELFFDYDTFLANDDTAVTTLTTGSTFFQQGPLTGVKFTSTNNAPVDHCATNVGGTQIVCTVTLVGTTIFQNGHLNGYEGSFIASGTIGIPPTPPPPPPPPPPPQTRAECLAACQELYQECIDESGPGAPTPAQCASRRTQCRAGCPQ